MLEADGAAVVAEAALHPVLTATATAAAAAATDVLLLMCLSPGYRSEFMCVLLRLLLRRERGWREEMVRLYYLFLSPLFSLSESVPRKISSCHACYCMLFPRIFHFLSISLLQPACLLAFVQHGSE